MCYAKPGPRCYGHAKETYDKIDSKIREVKKEQDSIDIELRSNRNLPKDEFNAKFSKSNELDRKLDQLRAKREEAYNDLYQTKGGLEKINAEYKEIKRKYGEDSHSARSQRHFRDRMETGYDNRIRAYDEKYHTVNGRKPSGFASRLGIEYLNEQQDEMRVKIREARAKGKDTSKFEKCLENLKEEEGFAKNTLRRIQTGKLKREYAPPSPRLQKTEAFQSYVQSAHAAPDVSSTARELKAIGLRGDGSIAPHPTSPEYKKAKNAKQSQQEELNARLDRLDAQYEADQKAKEEKKKTIPAHVPLQDRPYAEQQRLKEKGVQPDLDGQGILF